MLSSMGLRVWAPAATGAAEVPPVRTIAVDAPSIPTAAVEAPPTMAGAVQVAASAPAEQLPPPAPGMPTAGEAHDDRAGHIATLDWAPLREAVADCRACSLGGTRRQTVFGMGAQRAHWMVVGEAPGEQEDRQGLPFVGPSGELLDAMLRALGLTRAEDGPASDAQRVYIANTLKCRPPGNRNPAPDELARCEPFLVRQIALLQPRIILAMGRFAVQALLRSSEPVGRLRGRVHEYHGVPLVVTYHPAYLLRYPADKARAWDDLCLAAATAEPAG
jgi:uracil-DNA glycosylase